MTFYADDKWQREMRDLILKPYYERVFPGQYRFITAGDPLAVGGVDTILRNDVTIDEKIVRWPRNEDGTPRIDPYTAFALETMSCSVDGHLREGWMRTNTVQWLFYCFAARHGQSLDCYMIDFPALQRWFYAQDHEQWYLWRSKEINQTECRVVPIFQACETVRFKRMLLISPPHYDANGRFIHHCNVCGEDAGNGYGVSVRGNQLGTWFCKEHNPKEQTL